MPFSPSVLSQWFNKKTNQKDLVKMVGSKSICPKWHFGQVGHGGKKTIGGGGGGYLKLPEKKNCVFLYEFFFF